MIMRVCVSVCVYVNWFNICRLMGLHDLCLDLEKEKIVQLVLLPTTTAESWYIKWRENSGGIKERERGAVGG
jgi:hypothetical protein